MRTGKHTLTRIIVVALARLAIGIPTAQASGQSPDSRPTTAARTRRWLRRARAPTIGRSAGRSRCRRRRSSSAPTTGRSHELSSPAEGATGLGVRSASRLRLGRCADRRDVRPHRCTARRRSRGDRASPPSRRLAHRVVLAVAVRNAGVRPSGLTPAACLRANRGLRAEPEDRAGDRRPPGTGPRGHRRAEVEPAIDDEPPPQVQVAVVSAGRGVSVRNQAARLGLPDGQRREPGDR